MYKKCTLCGLTQSLDFFSKKKSNKDGLQHHCKGCCKKYLEAWLRDNLDRKREVDRKYAALHAEQACERARKWSENNPERKKETARTYAEKNKEALVLKAKKRRADNREVINARKRARRLINLEVEKERSRNWKRNNRGKVVANTTARKKRIKRATPRWLSAGQRSEITNFYIVAAALGDKYGIEYHVDHVVPIIHGLVCGLHVPWNLQLLTAEENILKSNKFDA